MTKKEALTILSKISSGTATKAEIDALADAVTKGSVGGKYISSGDNEESFDVNKLRKYAEELDKIDAQIKNIYATKGKYDKLTEKEQEDLNDLLKKQASIREELSQQQEIDRLKLELSIDINEEYEKQLRYWEKQRDLKQLDIKNIREGLTWEEKRYKLLTKIGEQLGVNTDKFKKGVDEIKKGFTDGKDVISKFNEAWGTVDQAASKYTRTIGGSKASMDALRKSTINFMETRGIGIKYNTSMEELIKLQSDYNSTIGRSIDLTNDQKETFAALKETFGSDQVAIEFSSKLENFGLNPDEVGDRVGKMFQKASKSGIAFEKYSKNFLDNIRLAQNYNFQNGLRGLDSMAKKATAIRLDMQQIANFADKVSTLEGATTAGAQLSVLGGSFARFGNPLSMLYEGLNDMEALQDRMVKMFGNLGKWDYSKGQVDVSVFNKQRIKAASESMGMDFSKVMEMINASARRNIVEGKLGSQYNNDQDFRELLLNKAQLDKEGNAYVTINGERKDINKLTKNDENYLKATNNSDSDNIAEIAVNTRGYKDYVEGFKKQGDTASASLNELTGIGKLTEEGLNWLGERSGLLKAIKAVNPMLGVTNSLLTSINGILLIINRKVGNVGIGTTVGGGSSGFGIGNKYGNKWKITDSIDGAFTNGQGTFIKGDKGYRMGRFMNGIGKFGGIGGAVAGLAGGAIDIGTSKAYQNKEKDGGYIAGKSIGRGLELAGSGAMIGSAFGPVGTLVGAGVGLLGGAIWGGVAAHADAKKENIATYLRNTYGATINDPSKYKVKELEEMQNPVGLSSTLKQKMITNGDDLGGFANGFKSGGYTGDGNVNDVAGTVHKGEIVIPNSVVKASGNLMNQITVSANKQSENSINNTSPERVKVDPININLNGTLNLTLNGQTTNIDSKQLLDAITPQIIDYINDQLKNRKDFRIDRASTHKKYAY